MHGHVNDTMHGHMNVKLVAACWEGQAEDMRIFMSKGHNCLSVWPRSVSLESWLVRR